MFSTYLRAGITLLVAPICIWVWQQVMTPAMELMHELARPDSPMPGYFELVIMWITPLVLFSLVIWVVTAALLQRQATPGGF